jgi:hypothetical protein
VNGVVAPTGVGTNLPIDLGVGGSTTLVARGGGTVGGTPCNIAVPPVTVAACTTFATRTSVTGLSETANGFTYGIIIQSVDGFGNVTNPPTVGAGFNIANPLDAANPLAINGVLQIGVDVTNPTMVVNGDAGSTVTQNSIQTTLAVAAFVPGGPTDPTGQWNVSAQDQSTLPGDRVRRARCSG